MWIAGDRFVREVFTVPAIESFAVELPDEQAAARLHETDISRGSQVGPAVLVQRLVPVLSLGIGGQTGVRSRNGDAEAKPGGILRADHALVIEHQIAGGLT